MNNTVATLTGFVLAAFAGYIGAWYFGVVDGNFALMLLLATWVTGAYWLAERFYFLPQRKRAAQAIEDGATLAACLTKFGTRDIPETLKRYEALRLPRASRLQAMSALNKTRFHLPDGPEQERRDRQKAQRQAQRNHQHQQAAEWAARMLALAKAGPHGYLQRKGLGDTPGLVLPEGELYVPMRDIRTNALVGAQIVQWLPEEMRWEKKYLYGMRSKGAVLQLGPRNARELVLCEGYATGLSIEAAVRQMRLNAAVLVTFSDSNLRYAAEHTTGRRYVIADNDPAQTDPEKAARNPGEAGQRAAAATGLGWAMSDVTGEDANDLHARAGLMAVCRLVIAARSAAPSNPWAAPAEAEAVP